jgi:8-oxo-dGTP diphosphatase
MSMEKKNIRVVAAVIEKEGKYLITQRRKTAVLPNLWEFPGGRVEEGEDDTTALKREIMERLDVEIGVGSLISYVRHPYEAYTVELFLYECKIQTDALKCKAVQDFKWVTSREFENFDFTPADETSMSQLLEE